MQGSYLVYIKLSWPSRCLWLVGRVIEFIVDHLDSLKWNVGIVMLIKPASALLETA